MTTVGSILLAACIFALATGTLPAQQSAPAIDFSRARGIYQRQQAGEKLTPEEQA